MRIDIKKRAINSPGTNVKYMELVRVLQKAHRRPSIIPLQDIAEAIGRSFNKSDLTSIINNLNKIKKREIWKQ